MVNAGSRAGVERIIGLCWEVFKALGIPEDKMYEPWENAGPIIRGSLATARIRGAYVRDRSDSGGGASVTPGGRVGASTHDYDQLARLSQAMHSVQEEMQREPTGEDITRRFEITTSWART